MYHSIVVTRWLMRQYRLNIESFVWLLFKCCFSQEFWNCYKVCFMLLLPKFEIEIIWKKCYLYMCCQCWVYYLVYINMLASLDTLKLIIWNMRQKLFSDNAIEFSLFSVVRIWLHTILQLWPQDKSFNW